MHGNVSPYHPRGDASMRARASSMLLLQSFVHCMLKRPLCLRVLRIHLQCYHLQPMRACVQLNSADEAKVRTVRAQSLCICCRCKTSYILTSRILVTYSGICHLAECDGIDQVGSPRAHQIEPNIMGWILQRIEYLEHVKTKRVPVSSARLQTVQPVGGKETQGKTNGWNQGSMASLTMLVFVASLITISHVSDANHIMVPNVLDS